MRTIVASLLLIIPCLSFAHAQTVPSDRVCLNGIWEFQPQHEYAKPEKFEQQIYVPSYWNHPELWAKPAEWRTVPCGWFRRIVDVPKQWQGQRIFIKFERIHMTGQIFWNGRHLANHWDSTNPATVDVTKFVKWGEANELVVGVREDLAQFGDLTAELNTEVDGAGFFKVGNTRSTDPRTVDPFGMMIIENYRQPGLARDVWLIHKPAVYVDNVFVRTSVRNKKLTVDYEVRNTLPTKQSVTLVGAVAPWRGGDVSLRNAGKTVVVPANGVAKITVTTPWKNPRLWSPDDPYLYNLQTKLFVKGSPISEVSDQRFGFREVWTKGRFIFLNGYRLNLRGDHVNLPAVSGHCLWDTAAFREYCRLMKRLNINSFRSQTHSISLPMIDACDEEGILLIEESGINGSCGNYATELPEFWDLSVRHLRAMVREERNHPSIIVWSTDNELGAFLQGKWEKMTLLTKAIKENDNTRIVWHDGFAYPFSDYFHGTKGDTDALCLHYPHGEFWGVYYNFPEAAYWVKDRYDKHGGFGPDKPIGHTEYALIDTMAAWDFDSRQFDNAWPTAPLAGTRKDNSHDWADHYRMLSYSVRGSRYSDVAYLAPYTVAQHYVEQAGGSDNKLNFFGMQHDWTTPGMKFVNLYSPYINIYDRTKPTYHMRENVQPLVRAYHPLLCFAKEYNTRFWADATVTKTFVAFNDLYRPSKLKLTVSVIGEDGKTVSKVVKPLSIPVGGHIEAPVTLTMPHSEGVTRGRMVVRLESSTGKAYVEEVPITVYKQFDQPGIKPFVSGSLPTGGTYVVAEDTLTRLSDSDVAAMKSHASDGGTVVVLAQSDAKRFGEVFGQWSTLEDQITPKPWEKEPIPTTIAHIVDPADPITLDMKSEDVQFWAGDHAVGMYGMEVKPDSGAKSLVICNRASNAAQKGLLVRIPMGKGQMYLCQMLIPSHVKDEPAARLLLSRLLREKDEKNGNGRTEQ